MISELAEILPELVELTFYGLSTAVLSLGGVYIEQFAFVTIRQGDLTLGVWAGVIGIAVCIFAYLMATDKFLTALADLKRSIDDDFEQTN